MRFFLLFLAFVTIVSAQDRPKIALVLSGGGARGGAHVGVLKVLEENNIPIDMIVGTSMGSFVGGLYASGKTPQEIEKMLTQTDWTKYITTNFTRQDIPIRKKELDYIYQGRLGVGVNSKNDIVLPTGVFKREPLLLKFLQETQNVEDIKDFDKLRIPYRAVATNIKNGEPVVLKSGSLARAMYASSAIPGGFQPIQIDGIDLVDGGVSDNFPIQVARDMGADIIIAVDVSENFKEKLDVNSYMVLMGQLVNIMMRKNANESIKKLHEDDILLTPDLDDFSGLDADRYKKIIQKGEDVALKNIEKLKKLSLSGTQYAAYQQKHQIRVTAQKNIIDKIELINHTYISDASILRRLHVQTGKVLDEDQLRLDILDIYHLSIFDSVNYKIIHKNEQTILQIITEPSWDNHGEIRMAFGIEDDFKGHSSYSMKLGYTMFAINAYGAEWRTDFEIGRQQRAYTEFYQPLDSLQHFYVKPSFIYENIVDIFPIERYTNNLIRGNIEVKYGRYGGTMAGGIHFAKNYEFELGASSFMDNVDIHLNIIGILNLEKKYYQSKPVYASLKIDSLDNINFPKHGVRAKVKVLKDGVISGSDYDYEQLYVDIEKPFSLYANNLTFHLKYGNTFRKKDQLSAPGRLYGTFRLGGLFNLSGYAPYSFNDDNMALGVLKYRYELKNAGFFGTLSTSYYAGFSLETGNVWKYNKNMNYNMFHNSASIYFAADTIVGPFYFAYGQADDGENSFYLYLGEKF